MKTPDNQDFPQKSIVQVFYLQNTPKTWDTQYDFSEYSGNSQVYMHNTDKSRPNKSTRENHDIFANSLQSYMWFCKGKIVKNQATTQNFIVALFYKINPVQNTTIIVRNTENLLNSVPHTIEITIQIGEKFLPIVIKKFGIFSSAKVIVTPLLQIAIMHSVKRSN